MNLKNILFSQEKFLVMLTRVIRNALNALLSDINVIFHHFRILVYVVAIKIMIICISGILFGLVIVV